MVNWVVMAPKGGVTSGPKYERRDDLLLLLYVVLPTSRSSSSLRVHRRARRRHELPQGRPLDPVLHPAAWGLRDARRRWHLGVPHRHPALPCTGRRLGIRRPRSASARTATTRCARARPTPTRSCARAACCTTPTSPSAPWYEFADSIGASSSPRSSSSWARRPPRRAAAAA